jgi:rod shape-determining protein MreC
VRPHMPVIAPDGVVGTVIHVAGDAIDVQLSVDAAFASTWRTSARTPAASFAARATRALCVQGGDGQRRGRSGCDDLLVTSGKGKWFPEGLPVARVTAVIKRELGRDQEVEATPTVNFSRLDAVLILVTPPPDEPRRRRRAPRDHAASRTAHGGKP